MSTLTLRASSAATATDMATATRILRQRLHDVTGADAQIHVSGHDATFTIEYPLEASVVRALVTPGRVEFRLVNTSRAQADCVPAATDSPAAALTTCDRLSGTGFSLAPAALTGADVVTATFHEEGNKVEPVVVTEFAFNPVGQAKWSQLTKAALGRPRGGQFEGQIAIVDDSVVVDRIGIGWADQAATTNTILENFAEVIVTQLKHGPLPVTFRLTSLSTAIS